MKGLAFHFIILVFTATFLVPSFASLFDSKTETAWVFDLGEEEKNSGETEKDAEKKVLFVENFLNMPSIKVSEKYRLSLQHLLHFSESGGEALLQPPELV